MWTHRKWPSNRRIRNFEKTDGNRTCSTFIRHSTWKMEGADKFCIISLWSFSRQIEASLLVLKIGSREHATNELSTFSPQKRNLEIEPSERLLPIFGIKNRILKIGSCERALIRCTRLHRRFEPIFPGQQGQEISTFKTNHKVYVHFLIMHFMNPWIFNFRIVYLTRATQDISTLFRLEFMSQEAFTKKRTAIKITYVSVGK